MSDQSFKTRYKTFITVFAATVVVVSVFIVITLIYLNASDCDRYVA